MIKRNQWLECLLLGLVSLSALATSDSPEAVWITGDVQGAYLTSGEEASRPGLVRLAGEWGGANHADRLLIDGGNLFFGHHLLGEDPAHLLQLPEVFGYDVVHIAYMDLAFGPDVLMQNLPNRSYAAVSANLLDRNGEAIARPFVIRTTDGQRLAITGVSGLSANWLSLTRMKRFTDQVEVLDPIERLRELLPEMKAEADQVVVLFAGEVPELKRLLRELGGQIDVVAVGVTPGGMNDPLPEGVLNARGTFGNRVLHWRPASGSAQHMSTDIEQPEIDQLVGLLTRQGVPREPSFSENLPPQEWPEDGLPLNEQVPVRLSGANRAMQLGVRGLTRADQWQGHSSPDDFQFLVLSTVAENRKPSDLIAQDNGQEAILFSHLHQALVLIHNGVHVRALHADHEQFDNAFPFTFALPAPRTRLQRDFIFLVPEGEPESLELRYHHVEYAPISIALTGPVEDMAVSRVEVELQQNELFDLGVRGIEEIIAPDGATDSDSRRYVAVDLVGQSRLVRLNPANHFRQGADTDARLETAMVLPYLYADQHLQLVTPSGHVYLPDYALSQMPRIPLLLPDQLTGGRLVFALPKEVNDYEFVAYFANMGTSTGGLVGFMEEMRFPQGGQSLEYADYPVLVDFELEILAVVMTHVERTNAWNGVKKDGGETVLLVDLVIVNETEEPGFWPMDERVGVTLADGRRRVSQAMTDQYGFALADPLHLPPGEPRRIRLAYVIPEGEIAGNVDVRGVSANVERKLGW